MWAIGGRLIETQRHEVPLMGHLALPQIWPLTLPKKWHLVLRQNRHLALPRRQALAVPQSRHLAPSRCRHLSHKEGVSSPSKPANKCKQIIKHVKSITTQLYISKEHENYTM
jgi:hypothetical protein